MNSSGTNYACSEHEDFGQYDQYAIPLQDNVLNMLNEHENLDRYVQYNLRECYVSFNFIGGDKEVPISVHLKANFHH